LGRLQDGLAIHDEALLFVRPQRSEGIQRCAGAVIGLALPLLAPSLAQAPSLVLAPPSLGLAAVGTGVVATGAAATGIDYALTVCPKSS
jgi:hypothetical protein